MSEVAAGLLAFVFMLAIRFSVAFASSFFVKWLWNAVVPDVFGLKSVTWLQALLLTLLLGMLFSPTYRVRRE
jgi:hypothetical protein